MKRRCARHLRRAITLIEMTTSLVIVAVLLVATGSAIVLASRAVPDRKSGAIRLLASSALLDQISADLTYATAVTELGARAIELKVPDRTGDGIAEVIRYAWDGNAGSPVTRAINGKLPGNVLDDVHEFALMYDRRRETLPTSYAEGPEGLLFSQETLASLIDYEITSSNWVAQTIRPVFAADVVWWRVTRMMIQARERSGTDGEVRVQVRGADLLDNPTSIVHDQAVLAERNLNSSYRWKEERFTRDARLTPGDPACIVLQWAMGDRACEVPLRTLYAPGGALLTSTAGTTWTPAAGQSMLIQVYGVTAKENPPQYRYTLNDVRVMVRAGADQAARVNGMVVPVNTPEVTPP